MSIDATIDDGVVVEVMALLRRVRGLPPGEAQAELRALASAVPAATLNLMPERNSYTGERDYGVLVRGADETAYVTCRGKESTAWLMHQVHDFRESTLLFVDAEALSVGEAVTALDELLDSPTLRRRLIDACIINRELKRLAYEVSDAELQAEVNAMRRRRGLFTVADTGRWMRAHGVSQQRLEKMATIAVRVRQVRHQLCAPRVDAHFEAHRDQLGRAALVRLRFANEEQARRAREKLTTRESFFAHADRLLGDDARQGVTDAAPRLDTRVVARHELEPALAAEIFARAGAVVGPQLQPEGAYLLLVSSLAPAETLDAELRDLIERKLFAEWLTEQRQQSTIEWNWGHDD